MVDSFWMNFDPAQDVGVIRLLALPRWVELSLNNAGLTVDQIAGTGFFSQTADQNSYALGDWQERARTIMSDQEVSFHREISELCDAHVFPHRKKGEGQWYREDFSPEQIKDKLQRAWHAVPLSKTLDLELYPVIVSASVIALVETKPLYGDTQGNIYERMVRALYALSSSHQGAKVFDTPLGRTIVSHYLVSREEEIKSAA